MRAASPLILDIRTLDHLALRLGYPEGHLRYFADHKNELVHKLLLKQVKNGAVKERTVYNPSKKYKTVLRSINKKLLRKTVYPKGVLGGVIGKCIDDMAQAHCGQEALLSLDLKSFFPGIGSGMVLRLFRSTGCTPKVAGLLTDLVTLDGCIPQGYPTSPSLANLAAYKLDVQQLSICKRAELTRTRWIDDVVFSGRAAHVKAAAPSLIGTIKACGFRPSNRKTTYEPRAARPEVLGLDVTGDSPVVPTYVVQRIRDILEECRQNGPEAVQANYECNAFGRRKELKTSLYGKIQHVARRNADDGKVLTSLYESINWSEAL